MNLETHVSPELWKDIKQNYDGSRYTDAIKDAIYHLSQVLREKANVEGDGTSLVGQALGGQNPRIKVTKLESQSDKDTQSGIEAMLRGLYQAIRNPRTHEKYNDSESDAAAIILFINYLLGVLNRSKALFSMSEFLVQVFDKSFVHSAKYAELLIAEIPEKFKFDVFVEVYRRNEDGKTNDVRVFLRTLLNTLTEDQTAAAFTVFSNDLRTTSSIQSIQLVLSIVKPAEWQRINPVPRMRIEGRILEELRKGAYDSRRQNCGGGALATWGKDLMEHMGNRDEFLNELGRKLTGEDAQARDYVVQYFAGCMTDLAPVPPSWLVSRLKKKLSAGDSAIKGFLSSWWLKDVPAWTQPFESELAAFKATPEQPLDEDVPF